MKLESLELEDIGGHRGHVVFPIDQLTSADKVVAIAGPTGAGKSTLLGSIPGAIYGSVPSYGLLLGLATSRKSGVRLKISIDGIRYLFNILLDGDKRKLRHAYIERPSHDLNPSGKVGSFRDVIARIFPPQETYLAAGFAGQSGGGRFLELSIAQRRALFASMLGLDRLQLLTKIAGSYRDEITQGLAVSQALLENQATKNSIALLKKELDEKETWLKTAQRTSREAIIALHKQQEEHTKRTAKLYGLETELGALSEKRIATGQRLQEVLDTIDTIAHKRTILTAEIEQVLLTQAHNKNTWLNVVKQGEEAKSQTPILTKQIEEDRDHQTKQLQKINEWKITHSNLSGLIRTLRSEAQYKLDTVEDQIRVSKLQIAEHQGRAGLLETVPCDPGQHDCPLLRDARQSKGKAKSLSSQLAKFIAAKNAIVIDCPEVIQLQTQLDNLGSEPPSIDESKRRDLMAQLAKCTIAADKGHEAKVELIKLAEREETLTKNVTENDRLAEELATYAKHKTDLCLDIQTMVEKRIEIQKQIELHRHPENKMVADKQQYWVDQARDNELDCERQVVLAREALRHAVEEEKKQVIIKTKIDKQTLELDDWNELVRVLGPQGAQALLIDAAGPEVSTIANQHLAACYGHRFALSLVTTALRADGKGTKEIFDLTVIDSEKGRDDSASNFSGGEKVIINEALSLAIAVYNARKSKIPMHDLFRDECAGALDHERAPLYIEMMRLALRLGEFHRCYFVAHQPHVIDCADAVIHVPSMTVTR
jgi:exonuclease SbcC